MTEAPVQYQCLPYARPFPPGAACEGCGSAVMLVRDHCHEHGWVRGIACRGCNAYLARIDRRKTPGVSETHLAALLAIWNSCPDCSRLDAVDLEPPRQRETPLPATPRANSERARMNRLRAMAARQGYQLRKTRRIDPDATDYGSCTLVPKKGKPRKFGSADAVEKFLTR